MSRPMDTMRSPEEIQTDIAQRRASLDAKIHELERRLSPRERMTRVRAQLSPEPYIGAIAATAVMAGAALAYRGWRRVHQADGDAMDCTSLVYAGPSAGEMMGE